MINDIFHNLATIERNLTCGTAHFPAYSASALPTDITETAREYILHMNVPGIPRDRIDIQFDNGVLAVSTKSEEATDVDADNDAVNNKVYRHLCERTTGQVSRRFRLPQYVDKSDIDAQLADGVLVIKLAKPDPAQARADRQVVIN